MVDFFGGEKGIFTEGFKKLGKIMESGSWTTRKIPKNMM